MKPQLEKANRCRQQYGESGGGGRGGEWAAVRSARTPDHATFTVQGRTRDFTPTGTGSQRRLSREWPDLTSILPASLWWFVWDSLIGTRVGWRPVRSHGRHWLWPYSRVECFVHSFSLSVLAHLTKLGSVGRPILSPSPGSQDMWHWRRSSHGVTKPASILDLVLASSCFCPSWGAALCSHIPGQGSLLAFFVARLHSVFCSIAGSVPHWNILISVILPEQSSRQSSPASGFEAQQASTVALLTGSACVLFLVWGKVFWILRTAVSLYLSWFRFVGYTCVSGAQGVQLPVSLRLDISLTLSSFEDLIFPSLDLYSAEICNSAVRTHLSQGCIQSYLNILKHERKVLMWNILHNLHQSTHRLTEC